MITLSGRPSVMASVKHLISHWRPAAAAFGIMFSLIAIGAFLLPNRYQSRAKILINNSRVNPLLSLDQQTQGVLYVDEVSEARINTEMELLTSTDVLRQVVRRCGLAASVKASIHDQQVREDVALRQLQKDLTVTAVRKSDIIEITYQSSNPKRSAQVVSEVTRVYREAHVHLQSSPGAASFFQQIADRYTTDLQEAESKLAAFRVDHHIVALPEEKSLALEQSMELEKAFAASSAATRRTQEEANHLRSTMEDLPETIQKEQRTLANQSSTEQLSVLLLSLENKRAEALQRYLPQDRIVKELDTQIQNTTEALQSARDSRAQEVTTGNNPTWLSAQDQYIHASADFDANRTQTQVLGEQVKANRARLLSLDGATVAYQALERRIKQFQDLADFYNRKSEEAKVNDQLDVDRISNVSVAEAPFPAETPSSPKRGLILALGFLWSLLLGVATAFIANLLQEQVRSPYELEEVSGFPLLASLPQFAFAPSFGGSFPAVYMSMQRSITAPVRSQE